MNIQSSINSLLSQGAYLKKMGDIAKKEKAMNTPNANDNKYPQTPSATAQSFTQQVQYQTPVNNAYQMNISMQRMSDDGNAQVKQAQQFQKRLKDFKGKRKPGQMKR